MRFDVITVFPEYFVPLANRGVVGLAAAKDLLEIHAHDLRDYTNDKHRSVDDTPFGGGAGMLLKPEPIFRAVRAIRELNAGPIVTFEPWGKTFDQACARDLALKPGLILVCGRYEGVDERVHEILSDVCLSIGNYVLTGGEIPAMTVIDAVARLLPGVLHDPESLVQDSFVNPEEFGYPQYTRPSDFEGHKVPEVLLSGDHARIKAWRTKNRKRRPEREL